MLCVRVLVCVSLLKTLTVMADTSNVSGSPVLVTVDSNNPAFMYVEGGITKGIYPAIIHKVFSAMNVPVSVVGVPWKRALKMGMDGKAGIGGIYKTADREKVFDYSAPLYEEKLVLYVRKGTEFPFVDPDDLDGKRIGVIGGWSYGDRFDHSRKAGRFDVVESKSDRQNFELLTIGRIDALIVIELAGDQWVRTMGLEEKVTQLPTPLATNPTYLVFNKSNKRKPLLKRFNETLIRLQKQGSLNSSLLLQ